MHEGLTEDVVSIRNLRVVTYVMEGAGVASLCCWVWWGVWCCSSHWAHRETTLHDILYDTNPPPQPLAKTCVVLGVCQTPTRWVTYIRSPTQNPSTHACAQPGVGGCLFFCCV